MLGGIETTSDNPGLNGLLSSVLIAMNDPALGRRTYENLISRYPKVPAYRIGLGYALLADGQGAAAESAFRKVLADDPGNASAQAGIGGLQSLKTRLVKEGWEAYYKGEYDKALSLFDGKRSEAAAIKNPAAEDGRGWALLAQGKPKEARDAKVGCCSAIGRPGRCLIWNASTKRWRCSARRVARHRQTCNG